MYVRTRMQSVVSEPTVQNEPLRRSHGDENATCMPKCGHPMYWHAGVTFHIRTHTYGHTYVCTYVHSIYVHSATICLYQSCLSVCLSTYIRTSLSVSSLLSVAVCLPLPVKAKPRRLSVQKTSRRPLASSTLPLTATLSSPPSHPEGVVHTQERRQRSLEDHHDSVPPTYREVLEKDQRDKLRQSIAGRCGVCTYVHTY